MVFVPLNDASDIHKCDSDHRESSSSFLLEQYTSSDEAPKLRPQDPVYRADHTWLSYAGVSILMSYGENPHYVKLPIFSEFMENSTKFMKNSDLTKWTQNLR